MFPERSILAKLFTVLICRTYPDIPIPVSIAVVHCNAGVVMLRYAPLIGATKVGTVGGIPSPWSVLVSEPLLLPARSCTRPEYVKLLVIPDRIVVNVRLFVAYLLRLEL